MPTASMRAAHRLAGPAILRWLRADVDGIGNVPGDGGVLLAANHRSFLDHFLLSVACPRAMRFLGKRELAGGLTGRCNLALGMVPVQRGSADAEALDTVAGLLRAGEAVGVFPEGTRSVSGELHRFRSGAARVAAAAGAPVVPVGLRGTAEVWPVDAGPPRRRPAAATVAVSFGEILPPPDDDPAARRAFTDVLYERVATLCRQPTVDHFAPIAS